MKGPFLISAADYGSRKPRVLFIINNLSRFLFDKPAQCLGAFVMMKPSALQGVSYVSLSENASR